MTDAVWQRMSDPDQTRREDLRWRVLEALYRRPTAAFEATTIRTVLIKGHDYSIHEVEAALAFLMGEDFICDRRDPMGRTSNFQIKSKGVLAFENR